jgi:hypothetical protein
MSKAETWVQQYRKPRRPGPPGMPEPIDTGWWPHDMENRWSKEPPYEWKNDQRGVRWRRYFDWSYSRDFRDNYQ